MGQIAVVRERDYRRTPWRNGGGLTAEIAAYPTGADAASGFDWRISRAEVAASGPFSLFPGYDRIIVQLSGAPMRLAPLPATDGAVDVVLARWQPHAFAGEVALQGVVSEPVRDFNCMVRRGVYSAEVASLALAVVAIEQPLQETTVVYAAEGSMSCALGEERVVLHQGDSAVIQALAAGPDAGTASLQALTGTARILLVSLRPSR